MTATVHTLRVPKRVDPAFILPKVEEAIQRCLDAADSLIGMLDEIDGDSDLEEGGDREPDLGAPEGHESQVCYFRGGTRDLERGEEPVT